MSNPLVPPVARPGASYDASDAPAGRADRAPVRGTFRALVIGDGALAAECAGILRDAGHELCGLASPNAQLARWAAEHDLPFASTASALGPALRSLLAERGLDGVDWIFSVVNTTILGPDVTALATRGVINYHDAPLPRYAGMHATSWALLAGEPVHGVTWHRVVERVDAGDILAQLPVAVAPDDTAFTLNTRCHLAAIESFRALVHDLGTGAVPERPQDLTQRSWFGRFRRPPAASVLRWDQPADALARLVRALDFGPVPNPLGRPRLLLPDGAALLAGGLTVLDALPAAPAAAAGTVVRLDADTIVVQAADRLVALRDLRTLAGAPLDVAEVARQHAIAVGDRLPRLDAAAAARLEAVDAAARRGEDDWVGRLRSLAPLALPYAGMAPSSDRVERVELRVPDEVRAALDVVSARAGGLAPSIMLSTACAVYWWRISDREGVDIGLLGDRPEDAAAALCADAVPLSAAFDGTATFADAAVAFAGRLTDAEARGPLLRDSVTRYPELAALAGRDEALHLPVAIAAPGATFDTPRHAVGSDLTVAVDAGATRWRWSFDAGRVRAADVARMMEHVGRLVTGAAATPDTPITRLPILPSDEWTRVVERWNETAQPWPEDATIASLVYAQAARTPDAVALLHGVTGVSLRYDELVARANALAHHLQSLGAGPEVCVGVCLPRTPELLVALLAVLASGAAYVPLDPAYPDERVGYMLADSGAPLVITDRAHAARVATRATADHRTTATRAVRAGRAGDAGDTADAAAHRTDVGGHARLARLRHLHIGLHRPAQRRRDRAPQRRGLHRVGARRLLRRPAGRRARRDLRLLRPVGLRAVRDAGRGRHGSARRERAGAGRAPGRRARPRHADQHGSLGGGGAGARGRGSTVRADGEPGG